MKPDTSVNDVEDIDFENPFKDFSFITYLKNETVTVEIERESSIYKNRKKRIYTFISIPKNLESFLLFSLIICLDHFLWIFTFLPLRCLFMPFRLVKRLFVYRNCRSLMMTEEIEDLVKISLVIILSVTVAHFDTSVIYHQIRSQSVIKLYIFFNLLEVTDRLLSPLGQDIMDSLSWTIGKTTGNRHRNIFSFCGQYIFALLCFFMHLLVMVSQTTILNVAFNSHSSSLLTIMLSNNFVELKGNVFRKVEKTNLFQMSCADARERFQYFIMLGLVMFRNIMEIGWSYEEIQSMVLLFIGIMLSEVMVDWVKHAFVTKFNFITADVYNEFSVSLAYDFILCKKGKNSSSYFELISRRMGLTSIPLATLINVFLTKKLVALQFWKTLFCIVVVMMLLKILCDLLLIQQSSNKIRIYFNQHPNKTQVIENTTELGDINEESNKNEKGQIETCIFAASTTELEIKHRKTANSRVTCESDLSDEEDDDDDEVNIRNRSKGNASNLKKKKARVYSEFDIILPPLRRHTARGLLQKNNNNFGDGGRSEIWNTPVFKRTASYSGFGRADAIVETKNDSTRLRREPASPPLAVSTSSDELGQLYEIGSRSNTPTLTRARTPDRSQPIEIKSVTPSRYSQRVRTISSLTEDLSDQATEPRVHSGEDATGLTSGINDGSRGATVVDQSELTSNNQTHESQSDHNTSMSGINGINTNGGTVISNPNSNNMHQQPLSDVDRFSMYTNQII